VAGEVVELVGGGGDGEADAEAEPAAHRAQVHPLRDLGVPHHRHEVRLADKHLPDAAFKANLGSIYFLDTSQILMR